MNLATKFSFCVNGSAVQKCSTDQSGVSRTNSEATLEPRRHGTERFVEPRALPKQPNGIEFDWNKARRSKIAARSVHLASLVVFCAVLLAFAVLFPLIIRKIGATRLPLTIVKQAD